ncbi:MAG: hypothetical protein ACRDAX_03565 [Propionibacteriaceae bacterium]
MPEIESGCHWDKALFSAKESIFKASYIEFTSIEVRFHSSQHFSAHLLHGMEPNRFGCGTVIGGSITVAQKFLLTSVVLPALGGD